ncbi:hypothetical protein B0J17DRAFT_669555 [Rhizoctonia solani]|nr:hypothetical protein B0J17DRAFT_669555 [Rhizoctonia solani]
MKRLRCIGPGTDGYELRKRPEQCRARPSSAGNTYDSYVGPVNIPTMRPSTPAPSRARSLSISDNLTLSDSTSLFPVPPTAPLTPRKRTRTELVTNSSAETLPEIMIHQASPAKEGTRDSVDNIVDGEVACPERLSPYPQPKSTGLLVPIDGPEMEEDIFFHQITEMLANMSTQEPGPNRKAATGPEKEIGKGKAKMIGEKLGATLEIKLPASQVAPPPTTPVTPTFLGQESLIEASESIQPTIRAVPPSRVLKLLNAANEPRESKASVQVMSTAAKENTPLILSKPPQGRERSKTVGPAQSHPRNSHPVKKQVRIVTPDRDAFIRPRKQASSANKERETSAPLALPRSSENWFSNLFHLRSTRYDLYSVHDVFSTRSQCIASLQSLGVRVEASEPQPQNYGGITLRCQLDLIMDPSGTTVVSKTLKFHVEIRPSNGVKYAAGYLSEIAFALDKGSPASFAAFCERVKVGWEMHVSYWMDGSLEVLEVEVGQPLPSPALTVGGRYAEV